MTKCEPKKRQRTQQINTTKVTWRHLVEKIERSQESVKFFFRYPFKRKSSLIAAKQGKAIAICDLSWYLFIPSLSTQMLFIVKKYIFYMCFVMDSEHFQLYMHILIINILSNLFYFFLNVSFVKTNLEIILQLRG